MHDVYKWVSISYKPVHKAPACYYPSNDITIPTIISGYWLIDGETVVDAKCLDDSIFLRRGEWES